SIFKRRTCSTATVWSTAFRQAVPRAPRPSLTPVRSSAFRRAVTLAPGTLLGPFVVPPSGGQFPEPCAAGINVYQCFTEPARRPDPAILARAIYNLPAEQSSE